MFCDIMIKSNLLLDSRFIESFNFFTNKLKNFHLNTSLTIFNEELKSIKDKIESTSDLVIIVSDQTEIYPKDNNIITLDFFNNNNIMIIPFNIFTTDNINKLIDIINKKINISIIEENKIENFVFELLINKKFKIGFCESCTGGLISSRFTNIPGVSEVFDRGIITYSNQSKIEEVGVSEDSLYKHGAVSKEVASEMAKGLLEKAKLDIALSVTGIAGPTGGTKNKPVGLVYIGISTKENTYINKNIFIGNRNEIQSQTANKAFIFLIDILKNIDQ